MKLRFLELELKDFKGVEDITIKFNDDVTDIIGCNGTGKSSLSDAINWVLFGTDANGKSKFDLFPLDSDNNLIPGKEPMVRLLTELNAEQLEFKRVQLKDTKCYVDGVPKPPKKYKEFVSEIIDETLFKVLLNPVYLGLNLKWQDQKALILDNFEVEDVIIVKDDYIEIKDDVLKLGVEDAKSKYDALIKELTKEINKLQGKKELKESEIATESSESKDDLITKRDHLNVQLAESEKQMDNIHPLKDELYAIKKKINDKQDVIDRDVRTAQTKVDELKADKSVKGKEYTKLMSDLKSVSDTCAFCGAELDEKGVEEQKKVLDNKIDKIVTEGTAIGEQLKLAELDLKSKQSVRVDNALYDEKTRLENLIKEIENTIDSVTINSLREQIRELDKQINSYELIAKAKDDLKAIKKDLADKTDKLDDAERLLTLAKDYHKEYSSLVADKLNESLKEVSIRTFKEQKNGSLVETFEITRDGVPYPSVNTAGKAKAGFELIDFISKALDLDFPIIYDNFEGIVTKINVDKQLITLSAVAGEKLRVRN